TGRASGGARSPSGRSRRPAQWDGRSRRARPCGRCSSSRAAASSDDRAVRPDTGGEMAHEQPSGTPDHGTPDRSRPGAAERRGRRGLRAPQDAPVDTTDWTAYRPTPLLDAALDKAVTIPSHAIRAHVDSVRRRNPEASPAQIVRILEREYLL